jgi:hypothetical protein
MILDEFRMNNMLNQSWHVALHDDQNLIMQKRIIHD